MEYVWVTGLEVCILEPLPNHHLMNHHLRMPELPGRSDAAGNGGMANHIINNNKNNNNE